MEINGCIFIHLIVILLSFNSTTHVRPESTTTYTRMSKLQSKRTRKRDFTKEEIDIIINCFTEKNEILTARHSNEITEKKKREIYSELLNSVNSVGGQERSLEAIKDKWQSIKSSVKKKTATFFNKQRQERSRTGGGEAIIEEIDNVLDEQELRIYKIIPPESICGKSMVHHDSKN